MKIKITAQPVFHLTIPIPTIELLMQMSTHHYDGVCKQASMLGGFLFGWRNMAMLTPEETGTTADPIVRATWDQIDITCKIMENTAILRAGTDIAALQTIYTLRGDLSRALDHWNRIRGDWVAGIDTSPLRAAAPHPKGV